MKKCKTPIEIKKEWDELRKKHPDKYKGGKI